MQNEAEINGLNGNKIDQINGSLCAMHWDHRRNCFAGSIVYRSIKTTQMEVYDGIK